MPAGWIQTSLAGLTCPRSVRAMRHAHVASACAVSLCQGRRLRVWVIFLFSDRPASLLLFHAPLSAVHHCDLGHSPRRPGKPCRRPLSGGLPGEAPRPSAAAAGPRPAQQRQGGPGGPGPGPGPAALLGAGLAERKGAGLSAAELGHRPAPPVTPARGGAGPPLLAAGPAESGVKVRPRAAPGEAPGARGRGTANSGRPARTLPRSTGRPPNGEAGSDGVRAAVPRGQELRLPPGGGSERPRLSRAPPPRPGRPALHSALRAPPAGAEQVGLPPSLPRTPLRAAAAALARAGHGRGAGGD